MNPIPNNYICVDSQGWNDVLYYSWNENVLGPKRARLQACNQGYIGRFNNDFKSYQEANQSRYSIDLL